MTAKTKNTPGATAALGDLDDDGLERLPEFESDQELPGHSATAAPDNIDGPTHAREAQLADLDKRSDKLNGTVRPSEQCGIVAGSGPYPGKRCTYAAHPHNQPHSWEVNSEPDAELPGHVYDDEQPPLPGTPEPEQDEYSIPFEAQFNGQDYQAAPGIEEIAERLIGEYGGPFEHLRGIRIRYFWKRRGGLKGGIKNLGQPVKPGGLAAYALGRPEFAIWLAADHCRDEHLTREQMDALIFDRLCLLQQDPEDHSSYRVTAPDFQGNILTIRRFGLGWHPDLRELGANMKQLGLLDNLELPDIDQKDGADDEGDDEGDDE